MMRRLLPSALAGLLLLCGPALAADQALTGTLAHIRDTGTFRIAYRSDSPPFSSLAKDAATPEGYSIDLCRRVADQVRTTLGLATLDVKYVPVTAENRFDAITSGEADIECGIATITLSRMEQVDFSLKTFITGASMLTLASHEIPNVEAIKGKRLTVVAGTTTEKALKEQLEALHITAKIIPVKSHAEAMKMLDEGKADAHVADQLILIGLAHNSTDRTKYSVVAEPFTYEPYGLVVRRGDPDFRLVVDRTLADLYRHGQVTELYKKWFGDWGGRPSRLLLAMWALNGLPE